MKSNAKATMSKSCIRFFYGATHALKEREQYMAMWYKPKRKGGFFFNPRTEFFSVKAKEREMGSKKHAGARTDWRDMASHTY